MRNTLGLCGIGLLVISLSATLDTARAQMVQAWTSNDSGTAGGVPMTVDAAGFVYEAPTLYTSVLYAQPFTIRVVKRRPDGSVLWSSDFTDPAHHNNGAVAIAVDTDGSVYAAGLFDQIIGPTLNASFAVLKYDSNGTLAWSRAPFTGIVHALMLDHNGGVYACGEDTTPPSMDVVVKYSTAGQLLWTTHLPVAHNCLAVMPSPTSLFFGGNTEPTTFLNTDFFVARIDPSTGAIAWSRTLDGGSLGNDRLDAIAADSNGNVALCGAFTNNGIASIAVALYDGAGGLQWSRHLLVPGSTGGEASRIAFAPNGNIVVGGGVSKPTPDQNDLVLAELDNGGNVLWQKTVDHGRDGLSDMCVDASGVVSIIDDVYANSSWPDQAYIERYDSAGNLFWSLSQPAVPVPTLEFILNAIQPMVGGSIVLGGGSGDPSALHGFLQRFDTEPAAFCFGDGSGSACPCGNVSSPGERAGCASSLGSGGKLDSSGLSEIGTDTMTLLGTNMPNASALYFQGTTEVSGGAGGVLGDGLRCAGGTVTRLGTRTNAGGASQYPSGGDPTLSVRGGVTTPGTRTYQAWYRNAAPFCTSATFNLTNGLLVTWSP